MSEAAVGGQLAVVKLLLKHGADLNNRGEKNRCPLWRAAFNGHAAVVRELLSHGADPRIQSEGKPAIDVAVGEAKSILQKWDIGVPRTAGGRR